MPESFDPYLHWLGISPKDQPPNHYRLLGIDLFESNADVIANATDQRMAHVRSLQTDKNSDISQKILTEILLSKHYLLNSGRKLDYDDRLRKKMQASLLVKKPLKVPPIQVSQIPNAINFDTIPTINKEKVKKNAKYLSLIAIAIGILLLGGIVAASISRSNGTSESKREVASKAIDTPKPLTANSKSKPISKPNKPQLEPKVDPKPESKLESKPEPLAERQSEPKADPKPDPEPETQQEPKADPKPDPNHKSVPVPQAESQPEATSKEKQPVPDPELQQKSLAIIRDIYKGEDRVALAKKLIAKATETQDATDRFVLLQEAKDIASETWQSNLVFEAIDAMVSEYDVSSLEMKSEVIEKAAKRPRITLEQKLAIAEAALEVIDNAIAEDNFDVAKKLGIQAIQLVRLSKNKDLLQEIMARNKDIEAAAKAYPDALKAMGKLGKNPHDPEANLVVGKYRCLMKGDWDKGISMLAAGNDEKLKALAKKELKGAAFTEEQMNLGESWWNLAEKQEGMAKKQMQGRAGYWYQKALPGLNGLAKDKAENRIAGLNKSAVIRKPDSQQKKPITHLLKGVQSELVLKLGDLKYPYQLDGEYKVPEGKQLEIEPGVTIHCFPGAQLTISGVLKVAGTEKQPITFKAVPRGQIPWKGIHFESAKIESQLEHVNVSDASQAIAMTGSKPIIRHCTFVNNANGIFIGDYGASSHPVIDKCIISFNFTDGIFINGGSEATITSCTITKNGGWGIIGEYGSSPHISKTIITLNRSGGVYFRLYMCNVVINNSILCENGNLDIKNESKAEWDLRNNYWGQATSMLRGGKGTVSLPNIIGKVRMDEFLESIPKDCGAGPATFGKQKLW